MAGKTRTITIERAKALAARWEAQYEEHLRSSAIANHFKDATPSDVIRMWETGRKERGQKLTQVEVVALVERWLELFGAYPPGDTEPGAGDTDHQSREPEPQDDTMLHMPEVVRMTGLSESTIKRKVAAGDFPRWTKLSVRRIGWPARDVKDWIKRLDDQRYATRQ